MREVISIFVGGAGIRTGHAVMRQMQKEHNISDDGEEPYKPQTDPLMQAMWQSQWSKKYGETFTHRALIIDTEPRVCDFLQTCSQRKLYTKEHIFSGLEDCAHNFARGQYHIGPEMIEDVIDALQRMMNKCENHSSFVIYNSCSGGTGSGVGNLILEKLDNCRRKIKYGMHVFSAPFEDKFITTPYNDVLSMHGLVSFTDVSMPMDNEALWRIIQNTYTRAPTYDLMNRISAKVMCAATSRLRFIDQLSTRYVDDFMDTTVPFPRLHFFTCSMAPQRSSRSSLHYIRNCHFDQNIVDELSEFIGLPYDQTAIELWEAAEMKDSYCICYPDYDPEVEKNMGYHMNFRGDISVKQATQVKDDMKRKGSLRLVDWLPADANLSLVHTPSKFVEGDPMVAGLTQGVLLKNSTAFRQYFERTASIFDRLHSQRAYVHWYVGEGMEYCDMIEAREDLHFLSLDYGDVMSIQKTDTEEHCSGDEY